MFSGHPFRQNQLKLLNYYRFDGSCVQFNVQKKMAPVGFPNGACLPAIPQNF
jgi:hypothetical protein